MVILSRQVSGRGGATIYLAGILKAHGNSDKKVFVADSFSGLPPPDERMYEDFSGVYWKKTVGCISSPNFVFQNRLVALFNRPSVFLKFPVDLYYHAIPETTYQDPRLGRRHPVRG